jgi:hypothetical protein
MSWELTGNAGTNPATNFLGTTDGQPLVIQPKTGSVGIGTTTPSPQTQLEIQSGFDTEVLRFGHSTVDYHSVSTSFHGSLPSHNYLAFNVEHSASDTRRVLTLKGDGNVGIGTDSPGFRLEVDGNVGVGGSLRFGVEPAGTGEFITSQRVDAGPNKYGIDFATNSLTRMSITNGGNVGIGTTTPAYTLEVNGSLGVSGDILLTGADCAEEFDIAEAAEIESGTVVILDQDGVLHQSQQAYDKRVAGVISGAGDYKPGLILDRQQSRDNRAPVALVGKVHCKVDAQYAPIDVGDLLTTSPTQGHAMKADDPSKAFGSVIGKALRPLEAGQGMIPILIALQ